jgi:hypothetical protein
MKIKLVKQRFRDQNGFKIVQKDYCCDRLKKSPVINLYDEYMEVEDDDTPHMAITEYSWEDEYETVYFHPIRLCPFCGEKIDISIVDEEDVTEQYNKLVNERTQINQKTQTTDSKKKTEILKRKLKELDKEIDRFYRLDWYKDTTGGINEKNTKEGQAIKATK